MFGGTFDPPHFAHVLLPRWVASRIGAVGIRYIPAGRPPLKPGDQPAPAHHRLAMLRLALADADLPGPGGAERELEETVDTFELDQPEDAGPSYTVDTLRSLHERGLATTRLRLLIGADQLRQFDRWKAWREVIELAEPVVMLRPPDTVESLLADLPAALADDRWAGRIVPTPAMAISSTMIRDRVRRRLTIEGFTAPSVAAYIDEHGLYRS